MKKIIFLTIMSLILTSCIFRPHKIDIEQGNIITQENMSKLHRGMSESQVKTIMGNPVLINVFSENRMEYVYTLEKGYQPRFEKRIVCIFSRGRLSEIQKY